MGCGNDARTLPPTNASNFHAFVCRRQPACAIAMKACPGLRSGIDRSSSLSFAIRGIHSSFRPIDSSFPRTRESRGAGGGKTAASLRTKACPGLRSRMNGSRHRIRHSGDRKHAPYPDAGPESRRGENGLLPLHLGEGWGEGQGGHSGEAWEAPITLEHFRKLAPPFSYRRMPAATGVCFDTELRVSSPRRIEQPWKDPASLHPRGAHVGVDTVNRQKENALT